MLKEIARGEDEDLINFLAATYEPCPTEWPKSACGEYWEIQFYGRAVFRQEKEAVLQILREELQHFSPAVIERMLFEKPLFSRGWPVAFQSAMIIARARNGGRELVQRDVRNAEFLRVFRLEERSQAALEAANRFLGHLFRFDKSIQEFKKEMQKGGLNAEKIGESECVAGEIKFEYTDDLANMTVMVKLPEDCSEELGRDIFGRTRRHIDRWIHDKGKETMVSLIVIGGREKLQLTHAFPRQ